MSAIFEKKTTTKTKEKAKHLFYLEKKKLITLPEWDNQRHQKVAPLEAVLNASTHPGCCRIFVEQLKAKIKGRVNIRIRKSTDHTD